MAGDWLRLLVLDGRLLAGRRKILEAVAIVLLDDVVVANLGKIARSRTVASPGLSAPTGTANTPAHLTCKATRSPAAIASSPSWRCAPSICLPRLSSCHRQGISTISLWFQTVRMLDLNRILSVEPQQCLAVAPPDGGEQPADRLHAVIFLRHRLSRDFVPEAKQNARLEL